MSGNYQIADCEIRFNIAGANYDLEDCDRVAYTLSEERSLTRGANSKSKSGVIVTTNRKVADIIEVTGVDMSDALLNRLVKAYNDKERIEFYVIKSADGSIMSAKQAILTKKPFQSEVVEGETSLEMPLTMQSYDVSDNRKSA